MYYISTELYYMTIVRGTVSFDFIFARQLNKEM